MSAKTFAPTLVPALLLALCGALLLGALLVPGSTASAQQAGACRAYQLIDDVTGAVIVGAEDIAIDRAGGGVFLTAYDRRAVAGEIKAGGPVTTTGGIYRFDLPDGPAPGGLAPGILPDGDTIQVRDLTRGFRETQDFRPHGFHLRPGDHENGEPARLYVVNRIYENGGKKPVINPAIERFRLEDNALVHEATIRPGQGEPQMCSPNDIWARADGAFYLSVDHGACKGFGRAWEETFALKRSYLLYFDGSGFRKVAENLAFANGVTGREDAASGEVLIIVSETRGKKLRVFDEADLLAPKRAGGRAKPLYTIKLRGSPDNLDWARDGDGAEDRDGDLLVATIPSIIGMAAYMKGLFGKKKTASRTQRIAWVDGQPGEPEIVFEDNGSMISGATVMAAGRGLYFIGAAFDDNIAICTQGSEE